MKTFFIISDTHGRFSLTDDLLRVVKESDYVIHLGDGVNDLVLLPKEVKDKTFFVYGNCDGGGKDKILDVDGYKILLTHGHNHGVKTGLLRLLNYAKESGVNAVFYGHTHIPDVQTVDGITLINPGSFRTFYGGSYCYAVLNENKLIAKIVNIR
ncbi:MAG: metallophosphoesterase [Clostridiales bacterium]|nr:metallophosphoesterase [Clostridiales bacterium]